MHIIPGYLLHSSLGGLSKVLVERYNVIMTLGEGIFVHDIIKLHCHQILVVIIHSCG